MNSLITIHFRDGKRLESHDIISTYPHSYEDLIMDHLPENPSLLEIEIYESHDLIYDEDGELIQWGDPGGSSFYLYDKENGLREDDE